MRIISDYHPVALQFFSVKCIEWIVQAPVSQPSWSPINLPTVKIRALRKTCAGMLFMTSVQHLTQSDTGFSDHQASACQARRHLLLSHHPANQHTPKLCAVYPPN